jgi:hypothetical protein
VVTPPVIVADTLLIAVPPPVNVSMTDWIAVETDEFAMGEWG